jgi:pilus assembly protein Flp/PilA
MLHRVKSTVVALWHDNSGASLLEYSVLVGLITAAVVGTIGLVSGWVGGRWTNLLGTLRGSPS